MYKSIEVSGTLDSRRRRSRLYSSKDVKQVQRVKLQFHE